MGAEAFDGRVRDGIGSDGFAWATRPAKIAAMSWLEAKVGERRCRPRCVGRMGME